MSTIAEAQARVWAGLLERGLAGKSAEIQQIDVVRSGDEIVCWIYFQHDEEFAVGFQMERAPDDDEIRRLLTDCRVLH